MKRSLSVAVAMLIAAFASAQTNILDARTNYNVGQTVTVKGVVTNGSELGGIRYLQDATGGIAAFPAAGSVTFNANRGDSVTITGVLDDFNGLLEIAPVTAFTNHGPAINQPVPQVITPDDMGESLEAELVEIDNAIFINGGSTFQDNTSYSFISNGQPSTVFLRTGHPLDGEDIPISPVKLVGLISQFTFSSGESGYQLLVRDLNDIDNNSTIYLTVKLDAASATTNSLNLTWTTNVSGTTELRYGKTTAYELGFVNGGSTGTTHAHTLSGLDAGEIYYVQAFSVAGADTGYSNIGVFATNSTSSGTIKVYFNHSVDTTVSTGVNAVNLNTYIEDTVIAYINRAQTSIDVCMYNNSTTDIIEALNDAKDRGVRVRYVAYVGTANTALDDLDATIGLIRGNDEALMHNKFLVFDAASMNNSYVWTGSTNFTMNNLRNDYNNVIIIQDRALARAYTLEFEEMFGSSGAQPDSNVARFSNRKVENTPSEFSVAGKRVEVYFSPSDQTNEAMRQALLTADDDIEFAVLAFTRDDLSEAIQDADDDGVEVKGIIEQISDSGEEYSVLLAAGIEVRDHDANWDLHHKYVIVDQSNTSSDPLVVTGSHNWSASADQRNDENTVIVHDATVANLYYQEFMARWAELGPTGVAELASIVKLETYPNPATTLLNVSINATEASKPVCRITDLTGKVVYESALNLNAGQNTFSVDLAKNAAGMYLFNLYGENSVTTMKFVKQ